MDVFRAYLCDAYATWFDYRNITVLTQIQKHARSSHPYQTVPLSRLNLHLITGAPRREEWLIQD